MKSLIGLMFLLVVIAISDCADDKKGCTIDGQFVAIGDNFQPKGTCTQITCDNVEQFHAKGCAAERVIDPENYDYIDEDVSKPYPKCCPAFMKKKV